MSPSQRQASASAFLAVRPPRAGRCRFFSYREKLHPHKFAGTCQRRGWAQSDLAALLAGRSAEPALIGHAATAATLAVAEVLEDLRWGRAVILLTSLLPFRDIVACESGWARMAAPPSCVRTRLREPKSFPQSAHGTPPTSPPAGGGARAPPGLPGATTGHKPASQVCFLSSMETPRPASWSRIASAAAQLFARLHPAHAWWFTFHTCCCC